VPRVLVGEAADEVVEQPSRSAPSATRMLSMPSMSKISMMIASPPGMISCRSAGVPAAAAADFTGAQALREQPLGAFAVDAAAARTGGRQGRPPRRAGYPRAERGLPLAAPKRAITGSISSCTSVRARFMRFS